MSIRIKSGRCLRARSSASMPLRVPSVPYPCASSRSWKSFMLSSLSSTIRPCLAIRVSFAWQAARVLAAVGDGRVATPHRSRAPACWKSTRFWERTPAAARTMADVPRGSNSMQTSGDLLRKRKQMAPRKPPALDREYAESLAVQALTYLAAEPERLGRFIALSGLGPEDIRIAAGEPGFLAGVL